MRKLKTYFYAVFIVVIVSISIVPVQGTLKKQTITLNREPAVQNNQISYDKEYELGSATEFMELQDIINDAVVNDYISIKVNVIDQTAIMSKMVNIDSSELKHVMIDTTNFAMIIQNELQVKGNVVFDYEGEHGVSVHLPEGVQTAVNISNSAKVRLLHVQGFENYIQAKSIQFGVQLYDDAQATIEGDVSFFWQAAHFTDNTNTTYLEVKGSIHDCNYGISATDNVPGERARVLVHGDVSSEAFVFDFRCSFDVEILGEAKVNSGVLMSVYGDDIDIRIKAKQLYSVNDTERIRFNGNNITLDLDLEMYTKSRFEIEFEDESHLILYGDFIGSKAGSLIEVEGEGSLTYAGTMINQKGSTLKANGVDVILENESVLVGVGNTQEDIIQAKSVTNNGVIVAVDEENKSEKTENSQDGVNVFGTNAKDVVWKKQADGSMWLTYKDVPLMKEKEVIPQNIGEYSIGFGDEYEYHSIQEVLEATKSLNYTDTVIKVCSPNMVEQEPIVLGDYESIYPSLGYQTNVSVDTSKYKYELHSVLHVYDNYRFTYTGDHGVDLVYKNKDGFEHVYATANAYIEVHHIDSQNFSVDQDELAVAITANQKANVVVNGSVSNALVGAFIQDESHVEIFGNIGAIETVVHISDDFDQSMPSIHIHGNITAAKLGIFAWGNVRVEVDGIIYTSDCSAVELAGNNTNGYVSIGGIESKTNEEVYEADIHVFDYMPDTNVNIEIKNTMKQPITVLIDGDAKLWTKGQWIGQTTKPLVEVDGEGEFIVEDGIINTAGLALLASDTSSIKIEKDGYLIGNGSTQEDVIDCLDTQLQNEGTIIAWDGNAENLKHDTSTGLTVFGEHAKKVTWFIDEAENVHLALDGQPILLVKEGELVVEQPSDKPTSPNVENPSTPNTENPANSNTDNSVNSSTTKETNTQKHSPDTGDVSDVLHFMNLLIITGAGILMILILKKKK
ncbi:MULTISPECIES: hypothetical protein [unclassified Breznakia]|uniref:hypothetical protein n=1 Tax=unclassified Breznakia TaxID=2623764 RepID=UPI002475E694|nr:MULTISPECIES: hypothetical protein [unclassified Breznakia]MDH6367661.1 hypothetical protein [Breznakia sp. PH1-1]MDH6404746.1 hypothetical protein [Breznakia sp. PF1-11]MDH6412461.1 hypothetical protein [Breznakia sp. PFB1-11]MDH6414821.1 hypothetical protein [Breznakia sp. PFB1-14]MDH6417135.1 hypothetical protein [Breznakia sp. PFB1-4]